MKMKHSVLASLALAFFAFDANSQCTGCTITISSTDATPLVVPSGTTLCITSTGVVSGELAISGGTVCNEGTINSTDIAVNSGTLNNYGSIDSPDLALVSGTINNHGVAHVTAFGITGSDAEVNNGGLLTTDDLAIAYDHSGTDPIFYNYGRVEASSVGVGPNCTLNNAKDFICDDFATSLMGSVYNTGFMTVANECANTGYFYTECTVQVGGDFVNAGVVEGPTWGCGGFSVASTSTNTGSYGADGSNLDICTTFSSGGFTVNTGTLGSGVTNCACTGDCEEQVLSIEEESFSAKIYPNPMQDFTTIEFSNPNAEAHNLALYNMQGQQVLLETGITSERVQINRDDLKSGIYLLVLNKGNDRRLSEKLVIE